MGSHANRRRQAAHGAPEAALRASGGGPLNPALRRLLSGAIDYAGLFPPASLPMSDAVRAFAEYRGGEDRWALGRFVVPQGRVADLAGAVASIRDEADADPWPVSVVVRPDEPNDAVSSVSLRDRYADVLAVEAYELRVTGSAGTEAAMDLTRAGFQVFVELPLDGDVEVLIEAIGRAGAAVKIRTGGITADAFPDPRSVLRVLRVCHHAGVRFKATAGLHHPTRGTYPLTYEPGGATGSMYGYLNVLLAAALVLENRADDIVLELLQEEAAESFSIGDGELLWRDVRFSRATIDKVRSRFMTGFGSCSFREPLDGLPRELARVP